MNTLTLELPYHWAVALVNGDESGMEDDDIKALEEFTTYMVNKYDRCDCVDVGEEYYFKNYHDATHYGILACDVAEFTFLVD